MLLLDNQLCFQFYRISKQLIQTYQPVLKPLGLTYLQYLVLLILWEENNKAINITISALCERLCLDTGTLSPLLKRMEKNDWIYRRENPQDQRQVFIFPSKKSLTLKKSASCIPQTLMKNFTQEEISLLISIQHKLKNINLENFK